MYHLESTDHQCYMVGQLMSKLRIGGKLWIGGLCPVPDIRAHCVQPWEWDRCFISISGDHGPDNGIPPMKMQTEMITDYHQFMNVDDFLQTANENPEVMSSNGKSNVPYLFWPPTHSLYLQRLS